MFIESDIKKNMIDFTDLKPEQVEMFLTDVFNEYAPKHDSEGYQLYDEVKGDYISNVMLSNDELGLFYSYNDDSIFVNEHKKKLAISILQRDRGNKIWCTKEQRFYKIPYLLIDGAEVDETARAFFGFELSDDDDDDEPDAKKQKTSDDEKSEQTDMDHLKKDDKGMMKKKDTTTNKSDEEKVNVNPYFALFKEVSKNLSGYKNDGFKVRDFTTDFYNKVSKRDDIKHLKGWELLAALKKVYNEEVVLTKNELMSHWNDDDNLTGFKKTLADGLDTNKTWCDEEQDFREMPWITEAV